jgi:hypothetical protein
MKLPRSFIPRSKAKDMVRKTFVPSSGVFTVAPDSELNVVEFRPPNMDESGKTKYPVLFHL